MVGTLPFILAVLIVAALLLVAMMLTKKRQHIFNKEAYQTKFLSIENKLNKEPLGQGPRHQPQKQPLRRAGGCGVEKAEGLISIL